ncbi:MULTISPECIES: hypothetical protein [Sphingomonas]|uniref:Uncharacterized protein n=1 Tax=Sphingomonas sanguinis TaxID=33051 RepID=A0A147J6L6_9SPHN|nr:MULTISPECIES: hypothetical protein [Sphingomonas]KTW10449.1 hypothetical protein NS258_12870 [Sphingomonas sanguinis]
MSNTATVAAEIAIMALTKTLMTICIVPKTRACLKMLPFAGMMNCGGGDRYMAAIFVFSR